MSRRNEVSPIPSDLFLPITSDVAQRGLEIIRANSVVALNFENDLINRSNIHLARYIAALAQVIGESSEYFQIDFLQGAAWAHLILRLQQQKGVGREVLSQEVRSSLPMVSEEVINQHSTSAKQEASESGLRVYDFFTTRGRRLDRAEPVLEQVIRQFAFEKLHEIPIPDFIQPDEQGLSPNFLLPGAAELYFIVCEAAPQG